MEKMWTKALIKNITYIDAFNIFKLVSTVL